MHARTAGRAIKRYMETTTTDRAAGSGKPAGPNNKGLAKKITQYSSRDFINFDVRNLHEGMPPKAPLAVYSTAPSSSRLLARLSVFPLLSSNHELVWTVWC